MNHSSLPFVHGMMVLRFFSFLSPTVLLAAALAPAATAFVELFSELRLPLLRARPEAPVLTRLVAVSEEDDEGLRAAFMFMLSVEEVSVDVPSSGLVDWFDVELL